MDVSITTPLILRSGDADAIVRRGRHPTALDGCEFELLQDGRAVRCVFAEAEARQLRAFLVELFPRRTAADHATQISPVEFSSDGKRFCVGYTNESGDDGFREGVRISVFDGGRPLACADFFAGDVTLLRDWLVANLPRS